MKTLWRAAQDDYVDTGYSFASDRASAEAYLDNPGFGGARLYSTEIDVSDDQVLDLTRRETSEVAEMLGLTDPGAIGVDEWLPRSVRALEAVRATGATWALVTESYPAETTTWIWCGTSDDEAQTLAEAV